MHHSLLTCLFVIGLVVNGAVATPAIANEFVTFDLPPTAAAVPQDGDPSLVSVQLRLSAMIADPDVPRIDQWLLTCHPRDLEMSIADYSPKTATDSDMASPVKVRKTTESIDSFGLGVSGTYANVTKGNLGADKSTKDVETIEFDRHARRQAVSASGTIDRGRGVYFKLRGTAQQVLEGERVFKVTFRVPPHWRGGLIDVAVSADATRSKYGGLDRKTVRVGSANFSIAAFRVGDEPARVHAAQLAEAEYQLRVIARRSAAFSPKLDSFPAMLRHVAAKLDLDEPQEDRRWLARVLSGRADPHLDKRIASLPMPVRVATLDYVEARDDFLWLSRDEHVASNDTRDESLVATPVVP